MATKKNKSKRSTRGDARKRAPKRSVRRTKAIGRGELPRTEPMRSEISAEDRESIQPEPIEGSRPRS